MVFRETRLVNIELVHEDRLRGREPVFLVCDLFRCEFNGGTEGRSIARYEFNTRPLREGFSQAADRFGDTFAGGQGTKGFNVDKELFIGIGWFTEYLLYYW